MSRAPRSRVVALATALAGLTACVSLGPPTPPTRFALQADLDGQPVAGPGPALVVAPPTAAAGFDGPRMAYVRRPHELGFFARSEWADAPARMLAPLLVRALERSGAFQAVAEARTPAAAGLRLETELVRLQQEFTVRPSRVRLTLRVQLFHVASRRVLGTRELEVVEEAPSDDPYGGVVAANRAVRRVLGEVVAYCVEVSSRAASACGGGRVLAGQDLARPGGAPRDRRTSRGPRRAPAEARRQAAVARCRDPA